MAEEKTLQFDQVFGYNICVNCDYFYILYKPMQFRCSKKLIKVQSDEPACNSFSLIKF